MSERLRLRGVPEAYDEYLGHAALSRIYHMIQAHVTQSQTTSSHLTCEACDTDAGNTDAGLVG